MEKSPAFQFYVQDFLVGVRHMNTEETGAYILLLCEQWEEGHIKKDAAFLKKIAKISIKKLQNVLEKFIEVDKGIYKNIRLEKEREKQMDRRNKLAENGRKGGRPSMKENQMVIFEKPKGLANQNQKERLSSSSSSSFSDTNVSHRIPKVKKSVIGKSFEAPELKEIAEYFSEQTQNRWTEKEIKMQSNKFFNYYTSNGWKVGKNAMKDWRATARNWILDKQPEQSKALSTKNNFSNETFTAI